jgi:peptide/nickel transport system ATP-binding protein
MEPLLEYERVEIRYHGAPVVRDLSLTLAPGEILGVVGESGCGKTTLIRAAMGLLGPGGAVTAGSIRYRGQELLTLSSGQLRRLRGAELGMIFQDSAAALCPVRTIGAQIYESMAAHRPVTRAQARTQAAELMEKLGLRQPERILSSYPFQLSGGQMQRVGIAMAMVMAPSVLLADEPTSALDVSAQRQVVDELLLLRRLYGTSILLVSHHMGVIRALADRIAVLRDGELVEEGPAEALVRQPRHPYTQALLAAVPRLERRA